MEIRRNKGAFFSSSQLRSAALDQWPKGIKSIPPVIDPSVGAGDLLLEVAKFLPIDKDLVQTLERWSPILHGRDLEPAFVRLAKARLVLLAASRGATLRNSAGVALDDVLTEIRIGNGLNVLREGWSGGHIVMNPPFTYGQADQGIPWASGRTNMAAVFLSAAIENALAGTRLTAILPDVIRTGSRYDRLRSVVSSRLHSPEVEPYGKFDPWTDVDVFILRGTVRDKTPTQSLIQWWDSPTGIKLGDKFNVVVGPVVPHRDIESGSPKPFLDARSTPLGGEFDISKAERRGYESREFVPPFVVVRRTSKPGDRHRGSGTIIGGDGQVQVENHLIVLIPSDGSLDSCRSVVDLLGSSQAKQWLDERIRCRHLTVQAIKEIPWYPS